MSCTAFTYGVHLEQLPEELHDLPDKAHKAALVAKMVTHFVCGFVRCVGCGFFGSGLFEFVSTTEVTLIVTVSILVSESCNSLFVCFTTTVVTSCYFLTFYTALCFFGYFVLCEGVSESFNCKFISVKFFTASAVNNKVV